MIGGAAAATAIRVGQQLRRDPRTIALIVVVPCVLETLLREMFAGQPQVFQHVGAPLLGLFPFVSMFVVTSVTMLRERTSRPSRPKASSDTTVAWTTATSAKETP